MEKENNKSSITDNEDMEKRVLVVGKLKGKKETKPQKTTTTKKSNGAKSTTKVATKTNTKSTTKKEPKAKTTTAKKATKTSSTTAKKTTKTPTTKKESVSKVSVKKEEKIKTNKKPATKNTGAKKVADKKKEPKKEKVNKIKIVEKIENLVKPKNKAKTKSKSSNSIGAKTKKAMEQVSVLRVDIKSEEVKAIARNVIIFILVVALAISLIYVGNIGKENVSNKILYTSLSKDIKLEELTKNGVKPTEAILTLKQENPEVQGWIKIDGTNINYPLLQGRDNNYYLTHNFKNEKTSYGSIFVNTNSDLTNDKANVIIYGHDMKDGQMFSDLIKYTDKKYYDEHKTIKITTDKTENEYTIVNVFKSRVFYKDEKNVFRFYQYYNLEDEKQFNEYMSNCKRLQLYDTGVEANYGEQLVTLITCDNSNENGRMVVVAKKN